MSNHSVKEISHLKNQLTEAYNTIKQLKKNEQLCKDTLQNRVISRTRELMHLNQKLKIEIEERKKIEIELRKSESRIYSILRTAPVGIGVMANGIITRVNERVCKITGYTREELEGQSIKVLYPSEKEFYRMEINNYQQGIGRGTRTSETYWKRKDGAVMDILLSSTPIVPSDLSQGITFSVLDITDRKQTERNLQGAKDKAESANRAKSTFIANMSHELRTPLNAIIGFSDLILASETSLQQRDQEFIERISNAGKHLLELINDLLDVSMIEIGKLQLSGEIIKLDKILGEAFITHEHLATQKGITLIKQFGVLGPIKADGKRLLQIINNLLSNAIKFTPKGGRIGLKAAIHDKQAIIEIWDTGIGIAPQNHLKIFNQFEQVEHSFKREFGGAGLGLAICKKLIGMHGGKIWLKSQLDKGSQFTFTIPIGLREPETITQAPPPIPLDGGILFGKKCLVIEDDPASRELIFNILSKAKLPVIQTNLGEQGLKLALDEKPDLIILDIGLPDISGLEVHSQLKLNPKTRDIPVIAISAYANTKDRLLFSKAGFNGYIAKPIDAHTFLEQVGIFACKTPFPSDRPTPP